MDEEEHDCNCPPEGLPAYMGTFADLMALLMCFFVLLLSFAEMDVLKFKRLAGSMSSAFGVQREIKANEVPKGTSIIAQEFSPGRPEPTPINEIRQRTADDKQLNLEVQCTPELSNEIILDTQNSDLNELVDRMAELIEETQQDAIELANALGEQIRKGQVEVETEGREITVRIKEKGTFASGSAQLQPGFDQVLFDVRDVLADKAGHIVVEGHTDNIGISTARFRSNWELSSARAVSVAHALLSEGVIEPARFTVTGYSYTKPLVENNTAENRAKNRRVEIVISQGFDAGTTQELEDLREENPALYKSLDFPDVPRFDISNLEIF